MVVVQMTRCHYRHHIAEKRTLWRGNWKSVVLRVGGVCVWSGVGLFGAYSGLIRGSLRERWRCIRAFYEVIRVLMWFEMWIWNGVEKEAESCGSTMRNEQIRE